MCLFPFNGRGRFGCDVVDDAVDVGHLVDNADTDPVQHVVGDAGPVSSHKVRGSNSTQSQGVVVGAAVAHDANAAGIGQDGEVLVHVLVLASLGNLVPEDEVSLPQQVGLGLGDVADDTDGQTGAGEGLAADQVLGQAQLTAQLTDLVLEQQAQGLDDLLKVHIVWQAAHVVVALDGGGGTSFHVQKSVAEKESVGFLLHFSHSL